MITFSNYFCGAAAHKNKIKASGYSSEELAEGYIKKSIELHCRGKWKQLFHLPNHQPHQNLRPT